MLYNLGVCVSYEAHTFTQCDHACMTWSVCIYELVETSTVDLIIRKWKQLGKNGRSNFSYTLSADKRRDLPGIHLFVPHWSGTI